MLNINLICIFSNILFLFFSSLGFVSPLLVMFEHYFFYHSIFLSFLIGCVVGICKLLLSATKFCFILLFPVHFSLSLLKLIYLIWRSDISNRARVLLSRWSKLFVRSQVLKKQSSTNSSNDLQKERIRKQRYAGSPWLLSFVFLFSRFLHTSSTYFLLIQDKWNSQRCVMAVKTWYPCNLFLIGYTCNLFIYLLILLLFSFLVLPFLFLALAYRKRFLLLLRKARKILGILLDLNWH